LSNDGRCMILSVITLTDCVLHLRELWDKREASMHGTSTVAKCYQQSID